MGIAQFNEIRVEKAANARIRPKHLEYSFLDCVLPGKSACSCANVDLACRVNRAGINYFYPAKELSVRVEVGVHYSSDLEKVERVTLEVAKEILVSHEYGVDDLLSTTPLITPASISP